MNVNELNNKIEESRKLSGVEIIPDNWIPKIGDKIVSIDNVYIKSGKITYITNITNINKENNIYHLAYSPATYTLDYLNKHFRKALPHEIPK